MQAELAAAENLPPQPFQEEARRRQGTDLFVAGHPDDEFVHAVERELLQLFRDQVVRGLLIQAERALADIVDEQLEQVLMQMLQKGHVAFVRLLLHPVAHLHFVHDSELDRFAVELPCENLAEPFVQRLQVVGLACLPRDRLDTLVARLLRGGRGLGNGQPVDFAFLAEQVLEVAFLHRNHTHGRVAELDVVAPLAALRAPETRDDAQRRERRVV